MFDVKSQDFAILTQRCDWRHFKLYQTMKFNSDESIYIHREYLSFFLVNMTIISLREMIESIFVSGD